MNGPKGRFVKGSHWRQPKPHWDRSWLEHEYVTRGRSASDIAAEMGCGENNILYWMEKHGIPRRSVSEARKVKHWGSVRAANPMWGKRGPLSHNWQGGISPIRARLYARVEWDDAVAAVWERDKGYCQRCNAYTTYRRKMHIHHIEPISTSERVYDLDNLVLLCAKCHSWVHHKHNIAREFLKGGDLHSR